MSASTTLDDPTATLGARFWRLVAASGLSNLADGVFKLGLGLVAVQFTRSPGLIAGLEVVRSLPWLLLALHVGALVDRADRRRTMVTANVVRVDGPTGQPSDRPTEPVDAPTTTPTTGPTGGPTSDTSDLES